MSETDGDEMKLRHVGYYKAVYKFGKKVAGPVAYRYYGVKSETFNGELEEPVLVLFNHTSDYDCIPAFKAMPQFSRFVVSADKKRKTVNRVFFTLITDFVYRVKGVKADQYFDELKLTIDSGINFTMAPEGQESPFGVTDEIRPKTGELVKFLGCGLVTFRIEGAYFLRPPWGHQRSKCPVYGKVVNVYSSKDLADKTPEEINKLIYDDLYINHYEWQAEKKIPLGIENRAEWMEEILFICPECGKMNCLHSKGNNLTCSECGHSAFVDEYGFFNNCKFGNLYDWHLWDMEEIQRRKDSWLANPDEPIFTDTNLRLKVTPDDGGKVTVYEGTELSINAKGISFDKPEKTFIPFEDIISIVASTRWGIVVKTKDARLRFNGKIPISTYKYRYVMKLLTKKNRSRLRPLRDFRCCAGTNTAALRTSFRG